MLILTHLGTQTPATGKSIAEQNSVVLAWQLLMDEQFQELRKAIYVTKTDFVRFRHLVVNMYVQVACNSFAE